MTRARLVALLAAAGTLLAALPAGAALSTGTALSTSTALTDAGSPEQQALVLLSDAADAARTLSYRGTQYVGTWRGTAQTSAVLDVVHEAGSTSEVLPSGGRGGTTTVPTPDLDDRLLRLLADQYDLVVTGAGRCAGRAARVVEVRRPQATGEAAVAGRFWLDRATGLVLRREVYDERGARLRSSAFVDVDVRPGRRAVPVGVLAADALSGRPVDPAQVAASAAPASLPGGLQRFDARVRRHGSADVLHVAYSDGLSTLSVFSQRGSLEDAPAAGFDAQRIAGTRVWVEPAAPERLVWQGGGRVFTVVSDADPARVREVVQALPHDPAPSQGLLARLGRGLARVGSWINPFS